MVTIEQSIARIKHRMNFLLNGEFNDADHAEYMELADELRYLEDGEYKYP